jgi:hypothetical protein
MKLSEFEKQTEWGKEDILAAYSVWFWCKRAMIASIFVVCALLAGCPPYNVWKQGLAGEAELARAEQNRQILINEAKAKEQSAKHWANAEIERAKGAAEANKIVAKSLGGSEGYLRWLFIEKLDEIKDGQIIYLPTEAGIPLLEAGKR